MRNEDRMYYKQEVESKTENKGKSLYSEGANGMKWEGKME